MGRTRCWVIGLVTSSLLLAMPSPASAAPSDHERAERAIGYIRTQQQEDGSIPAFSPIGSTADAVLAIVASGVGKPVMKRALDYLEAQVQVGNVTTVGLQAKVVMAWRAAGRNPRNIAGENLVAPLRQALRTPGEHTVFDVALAVLAVRWALKDMPWKLYDWLQDSHCPDGGWAFDAPYDPETDDEHCYSGDGDWFMSDTNTTAYMVMAILTIGPIPGGPGKTPWGFFKAIRDPESRGWGYTWGYQATDANSTALVIQAYESFDVPVPIGARRALRGLQYTSCGAFAFTYSGGEKGAPDVGATIGAVPGLLGKPFPYTGPVEGPAPATPDCPV